MPVTSLLVNLDIDDVASDRVALAAELARRFGAKLIGLSAALVRSPILLDDGFGDPGIVAADHARLAARLKDTEGLFHESSIAAGPVVEWRSAVDSPTDFLINSACAADLLVIGHRNLSEVNGLHRAIWPGEVIVRSGRPVLLLPPGRRVLEARKVVFAWKNTRETRRILSDSLPFLTQAKNVLLTVVDEGRGYDRSGTDDVVGFLQGHDVIVQVVTIPATTESVTDGLLRIAEREDSDLLVSGAYGHSRLREWAFGGVTRSLLESCPIPWLTSH